MKIGLILECATDGPDWQVYSLWVKRLLGDEAQVEQSSAVNKKLLVQQAGVRTRDLFAEGCDKVFLIWDLWPAWDQSKPDQAADFAAIEASLRQAGVTHPCVYLLCVNRMLETLLIADGKALTAVLGIPKGKKTPGNKNKASTERDPKAYLGKWFKEARKGDYSDYAHARQIALRVDLARLRLRDSQFARMDDSLRQVPCAPPLAWVPSQLASA